MLRYVITARPTDDPLTVGELVAWEDMPRRVDELSGRPGAWTFVRDASRQPRTYIATAAGSPRRATYGRGFIVHKVND